MSRIVRKPVSLFGLAFVFMLVPVWWHFRASPALAQGGPELTANQKQSALTRAGIDSTTLAASGLSANSARACVQAGVSYLLAHSSALRDADAAVGNAQKECDRLLRTIQAGKASENDAATYQTQLAAVATATSLRQTVLDAIFDAASAGLSNQQKTLLTSIRSNRTHTDIPVEFRTVERSKADWLQLREDLANERISAKRGEEPYAAGQARLATCRADQTVAAAKTAVNTNLASITTSVHSAIAGN